MCGISLIYHANGKTAERQKIVRMNQSLLHRGPDANGVMMRQNAALGHTRLSIVDLNTGAQPMATSDDRFAIVFNGEIYNYRELRVDLEQDGIRFHTHTDTEVVLQLFRNQGSACIRRLRGMFSFAIHDAQTGELFVVRDRLGIKPLYYHWDGHTLVAGSEIKAIFSSGLVTPKFNPASIKNYFSYQFSISPHTPFDSIYELPPGHQLTLRSGGSPELRCYWNIEFPTDDEYESLDEDFWTMKFNDALEEAARTHTIGDVPIGSYLSGGIDSSAMTWLLTQQYSQPVQTFSIHFTNPSTDESEIYRKTAEHLGVRNMELVMEDNRPEGYLTDLERCIYHLEQPQRMAVDIPHFLLSGLVQKNQYKVVYTGDGADEIMGGYDCYRQDYMRYWGNQIDNPWKRNLHYLSEYTNYFSEHYIHLLMRLHKPRYQQETIAKYSCYPAWFDFWHITEELLPGLFNEDFEQATRDNTQLDELVEEMRPHLQGRHMLNQSLYIETKTRLPGWILWKSDRLSMAHSVEARVPFMDHSLVELAARTPPGLKLNGMNEKYILKKIANPHLPEHPSEYKKRAFYTPIREWFFTIDKVGELNKYLSREALDKTGIFNTARVSELYQRILQCDTPTDMNTYYRVMQLEWILMLVLTVQIMHHQFIEQQAECFQGI